MQSLGPKFVHAEGDYQQKWLPDTPSHLSHLVLPQAPDTGVVGGVSNRAYTLLLSPLRLAEFPFTSFPPFFTFFFFLIFIFHFLSFLLPFFPFIQLHSKVVPGWRRISTFTEMLHPF